MAPFGLRLPRIRTRYYFLAFKEPHQEFEDNGYPFLILRDKKMDEYHVIKNSTDMEIPKGSMMEEIDLAGLKSNSGKLFQMKLMNLYHPSEPASNDKKLQPVPDQLVGQIEPVRLDEDVWGEIGRLNP